jgi:hypothetical protein
MVILQEVNWKIRLMGKPQPRELPYGPQLTAELAAMEEFIDQALNDASPVVDRDDIVSGIVEQRAKELWEAGAMESLADFEACLRGIGSRAYCLALPAYAYQTYSVWSPVDAGTEPKFAMAVANGKHQAGTMLQEWSMDPAENLNRLAIAGLLRTGE